MGQNAYLDVHEDNMKMVTKFHGFPDLLVRIFAVL
jgi:hypothetical protein